MKQNSLTGLRFLITFFLITFIASSSTAQKGKIDWAKDTLSQTDALGARMTYENTIKGSGQKPTLQINLQVDKLKEIMDACNANNIYNVAVMIITLRQQDVQRYKNLNPGTTATDNEIKGSQMLVFKVPRAAFAGMTGAKINTPKNNSLMVSLLSAGLVVLDDTYADLPFGRDDIYLSFGTICPPPTSCD